MAAKFTSRPVEQTQAQVHRYEFEMECAGDAPGHKHEPVTEAFSAQMDANNAEAGLEWSELAATAATGDADMESAEGAAFTARFFMAAMPDGGYRRFKQFLRVHKTSSDVLLAIMQGINEAFEGGVEADAERPTMQPSPFSGGQTATVGRRLQIISLGDEGDVVEVAPAHGGEIQHGPVRVQRTTGQHKRTKGRRSA